MSENVRKLIGVAVMTAIVVVGVVATSGDDSDFTRNAAFAKGGVMAKEALVAKSGDCCDEALYRIAQLEERIARLEGNSRVANESAELAQDLDAYLGRYLGEDWFDSTKASDAVGSRIVVGGFLIGVEVEVARAAVLQIGVGFQHYLADGERTGEIERRGTRRDPRNTSVVIRVGTRNGIVERVWYRRVEPGN